MDVLSDWQLKAAGAPLVVELDNEGACVAPRACEHPAAIHKDGARPVGCSRDLKLSRVYAANEDCLHPILLWAASDHEAVHAALRAITPREQSEALRCVCKPAEKWIRQAKLIIEKPECEPEAEGCADC